LSAQQVGWRFPVGVAIANFGEKEAARIEREDSPPQGARGVDARGRERLGDAGGGAVPPEPETVHHTDTTAEKSHANAVDALAAGASEGTVLAINVAAMLIAFLAFLALADYALGLVYPGLTLARIFAVIFAPAAVMMGVPMAEVPIVADLLGTKLVANEFVAYLKLTTEYTGISRESLVLSTYALTGFANVGSIGILIGGIGAMAPTRRGDLARLGGRALLGGFVATMINAAIASMLL